MYVPLRLPEDAAKAADGLAVLRPQEAQAAVRESINHKLLFFNFSPLFRCEFPRLFLYVNGRRLPPDLEIHRKGSFASKSQFCLHGLLRGCDRRPAAQHARNTAAGGRRDGYALKGIAIVHEDYKATFAVSLPGLRLKTHRRSATIQHRLVVGEDAHVGSLAKVPE